MAIVVTSINNSMPLVGYWYNVTGLANGANTITLPTAPAQGSFPVTTATTSDWTPTFVYCFPYNAGAVGTVVTIDPATISISSSAVSFTLYATGATNVRILVA